MSWIKKIKKKKKKLAFNDVKSINLDDVDNGPINHSEIEKWKRKVIKNKKR